ncbi:MULTISPECIES: DUF6167 family protein [Streptomyces]|uniref:Secreted protein n=1 Tax=Streptomyces lycii TaxID=2654337 RepID=A0ABQ7FML0_9ACTN|nr:DUF6167 family protein [Streptomyces lycii]KAF4409952.1 hypothetical protein GCU69_06360 [Streptomyces lycii]
MFRRTFWFTAGAATGVWATTKVHRKLRRLTPESLAAQAADKAVEAGHRLKDFALDVKAGMAQRELELNDALGLDAPDGTGELPAARRPAALGGPRPAGQDTQRPPARGTSHPPTPTRRYPYDPHNRNEDH